MTFDTELAVLLILALLAGVAASLVAFVIWPAIQDVAVALGFLIAVFTGAS